MLKKRIFSLVHHDSIIYVFLSSGTRSIAPAITLCSNAADMAKWLKFQLNTGKDENDKQLIDESFMKTTHRPLVIADDMLYNLFKKPTMPVTDSIDKYALGWFNGYYKGMPTGLYLNTLCRVGNKNV